MTRVFPLEAGRVMTPSPLPARNLPKKSNLPPAQGAHWRVNAPVALPPVHQAMFILTRIEDTLRIAPKLFARPLEDVRGPARLPPLAAPDSPLTRRSSETRSTPSTATGSVLPGARQCLARLTRHGSPPPGHPRRRPRHRALRCAGSGEAAGVSRRRGGPRDRCAALPEQACPGSLMPRSRVSSLRFPALRGRGHRGTRQELHQGGGLRCVCAMARPPAAAPRCSPASPRALPHSDAELLR